MQFESRIDGPRIHCILTPDRDLVAPVLCFSLMVPAVPVSGGTRIAGLGGYTEIQLPDLVAGQGHEIVVAHEDPAFAPANRAWLPLGPYLRTADGPIPLPAGPAGVMGAAPLPEPHDGLRLIPAPARWTPAGGTLTARTIAAGGEPFEAVAALARRTHLGPFLSDDGAPLTLLHDDALSPEAYGLSLAPEGITLRTASRAGTFHAAITLLTLIHTHDGALPCGEISDSPRFGWRGQHLDCARHYYRPDTILRLLDLMALLKMNRFHWHFADDEAFRLEVTCLPELWQKTRLRGEGHPIPGVFGGGLESGGSYSPADVAAILAHARALNIDVLPEIEVPAHALALNRAIPGLRDPDDTGDERSVQGYPENTVNPALPRTWEVLETLADEVAGMFPFRHLHLGCDELPPDTWAGSPAVAALMAREGLQTTDDVQGWTMARLAARLADQGIRPAAWEEAARGANGGIGAGALLFSWTGQGPGIDAARAGHDVVMTPGPKVYLDMAHSDDPDDWGASWAAVVPLEETVNWDPVPPGAMDIADRVVGVQGTFWSEFTTEDSQMEPMLAPRILGVATKAWEPDRTTDGATLRRIAGHYAPIFDRMGWRRHRGA